MDYRNINKLAEVYFNDLKGDNKGFNRNIFVLHEDGSTFKICYAFLERWILDNFNYIIMFSEHNGFILFYESDLKEYYQTYEDVNLLESNSKVDKIDIKTKIL